jgi:hypothetical protein
VCLKRGDTWWLAGAKHEQIQSTLRYKVLHETKQNRKWNPKNIPVLMPIHLRQKNNSITNNKNSSGKMFFQGVILGVGRLILFFLYFRGLRLARRFTIRGESSFIYWYNRRIIQLLLSLWYITTMQHRIPVRPVTFNLLKHTGHVTHHQQFNIQQLYALPTLYWCVLYLSENKQRLLSLTV